MEIIVKGEPRHIDFILRISRDKVRRGELTILSATNAATADKPTTKAKNPRKKKR